MGNLAMLLSLRLRIILGFLFCGLFSVAGGGFVLWRWMLAKGEDILVDKAETVIGRAEIAKKYVSEQNTLKERLLLLKRKWPDGNIPASEKEALLMVVPIVGAMHVGGEDSARSGYQFRLVAFEPRNPDNRPDTIAAEALKKFMAGERQNLRVRDDSDGTLRYYSPIVLQTAQGCHWCHGNPILSPWGNGKDILGFPMENYKDGDIRGAYEVKMSLKPMQAEINQQIKTMFWVGALCALLACLIVWWLFRPWFKKLFQLVSDMRSVSREVENTAQGLSSNHQILARGTHEQGSAIEQTVAAMEEMAAMLQSTAGHASHSLESAEVAGKATLSGSSVMGELSSSMDSIADVNMRLEEVVHIIDDIANKALVIHDIVFKTQLLSFNASIEAARAGPHGKGFAVVAEEVGKLAQLTGEAAGEIESLLENSKKQVGDIVSDTNRRVQEGIHVSREALNRFLDVSERVTQIQESVKNIALASQEQALGIQQTNKAMGQISHVTHTNSQMSAEGERITAELRTETQRFSRLSRDLEQILLGRSAGKESRRAIG